MDKNHENKKEEEKSFKTCRNLHYLTEVFHKFGFHFGKLEQGNHFKNSNYLRQSAYPGDSCESVKVWIW